MKFSLNTDFHKLGILVQKMGAEESQWKSNVVVHSPVDEELEEGLEFSEEALQEGLQITPKGLLSYKGRLITLHIRERSQYQNSRYPNPTIDGMPRFHIADCQKLQQMRKNNRDARYVMKHNCDGLFQVLMNGVDGKHPLHVCQYCLTKIEYKGFMLKHKKSERQARVRDFVLKDFFEEFSSSVKRTKYTESSYPLGDGKSGYTKDFNTISGEIRKRKGWLCEQCGKDFSNDKKRLHAHHINGVKADNHPSNLKSLCDKCHAQQPGHGHMLKGGSQYSDS